MEARDIIAFAGLAEPVSSLTHLAAAAGYCVSAPFLLRQVRGDRQRQVAVAIFLGGMTSMFLASGVYHLIDPAHPARAVMRRLDHGMIWVAITSTISAIRTLAWPDEFAQRAFLWALCLGGIVTELFFLEDLPLWVSPMLYVIMGNLGLFPFVRLVREHGFGFPSPILFAGAAATTGAVIDATEWPNPVPRVFEAHELLHVFIVIGMALFWWGIHRGTTIPRAVTD